MKIIIWFSLQHLFFQVCFFVVSVCVCVCMYLHVLYCILEHVLFCPGHRLKSILLPVKLGPKDLPNNGAGPVPESWMLVSWLHETRQSLCSTLCGSCPAPSSVPAILSPGV